MDVVAGSCDLNVDSKRSECPMSPSLHHSRIRVVSSRTRAVSRNKRFESKLLEVADEERRRIGQELHDVMGQELLGIAFQSNVLLEKLQERCNPEAKLAVNLHETIRQLLSRVRTEAWGLIPMQIEAAELNSALAGHAAQVCERFGIECQFVCEEPVLVEDRVTATNLYRIAQEAVTNSIKHGNARRIGIRLNRINHLLTLQIQDDGHGLQNQTSGASGLGLQIMRYRAGLMNATLDVQPVAEGGVRVTCSVKAKVRC
jgi:signal transduction histidine kinase